MAFGTVGDQTKFYFFGQEVTSGTIMLVELVIAQSTQQATATIKASAPQHVPLLSEMIRRELSGP